MSRFNWNLKNSETFIYTIENLPCRNSVEEERLSDINMDKEEMEENRDEREKGRKTCETRKHQERNYYSLLYHPQAQIHSLPSSPSIYLASSAPSNKLNSSLYLSPIYLILSMRYLIMTWINLIYLYRAFRAKFQRGYSRVRDSWERQKVTVTCEYDRIAYIYSFILLPYGE